MSTTDRSRLLFGPYRAPLFRYGRRVLCKRAGQLELCGLSACRIAWPLGRRPGSKARGLVLYADLAKAVRLESACAVAYWWGITAQTVTLWRRALGVGPVTTRTSVLRASHLTGERFQRMCDPSRAKDRDPERLEKIAASKRGKPRLAHVVEAVRAAHLGTKASAETREKMSEAHRRRGTRPPKAGRAWTACEDGLVKTLSAKDAAVRTGRTLQAVYDRRHELQLPDGRRRRAEVPA